MKLTKIAVWGLFNRYDYEITIEPEVTILHGLNGVGKSTILQLVYASLAGKYNLLEKAVFRKIAILFEDGSSLIAKKEQTDLEEQNNDVDRMLRSVQITRVDANGNARPIDIGPAKALSAPLIEREYPFLERIGPRQWYDEMTGETLSYEDVLLRYVDMPATIPARMVDANRLQRMDPKGEIRFGRRRPLMRDTVSIYSEELAQHLGQKILESATLSQELDRTFPQRLIALMLDQSKEAMDPSKIENQLRKLEQKRKELEKVGLLDKGEQAPVALADKIEDATRRVLSLYIEDTQNKLAVFDEMFQKVNLFLRIIGSRFRNKEMRLSREKGFIFTAPEGDELKPDQLSSGEQHELIMVYELLFKADRESVILIDEPEISLHLEWQQKFLEDLLNVVSLTHSQVLMATHSADIIRDHWDITRALREE